MWRLNMILFLLVLASGMGLIMSRHETRVAYAELHVKKQQRNQLLDEWGRISLELSTWAAHDRVEYIAQSDLQLREIEQEKLLVLEK